MCTVCGCDGTGKRIDAKNDHSHDHPHHHGADHDHHDHGHHHHDRSHHHRHDHHHHHTHGHHDTDEVNAPLPLGSASGTLDYGAGAAGVSVPGVPQRELISIERRLLSKNDALAAENRSRFREAGVTALNLMSSPGAGKTTLLVETIKALKEAFPAAVIEGDQQTSNDAARIRATGVDAIQVNTGKGCHLDAEMVRDAFAALSGLRSGFLFIENVGNLVCPASFDLGEAKRVVLASVTEGEDKPLKYPDMFATADLLVVTKADLLPYLRFDLDAFIDNARRIRPGLEVVTVSSEQPSSGQAPGLDAWLAWLHRTVAQCGLAAE